MAKDESKEQTLKKKEKDKKRTGTIKKKFESPRSKSADAARRNFVARGLASVVSRSLPVLGKGKVSTTSTEAGEKKKKKKKRRRRRRNDEEAASTVASDPETPIVLIKEDTRKKTLWRHIALLFLLFAYSLLGGLVFSSIEGGFDQQQLTRKYERDVDLYERRKTYQHMIYRRFKDLEDIRFSRIRSGSTIDDMKLELVREAITWYERKLGFRPVTPAIETTRWNLWGGVYYSASLYTTIGYGNFHPKTLAGRVISMLYAFVGIPLVFMILLEWGFLYFECIEYGWRRFNEQFCQRQMHAQIQKRKNRERFRRMGSEMSLGSLSTMPLLAVHRTTSGNQTDHQIESNHPLKAMDVDLNSAEQVKTVPMKAALLFFLMWLCISAFVVRLWEREWSYFTAFYFFFTSLTTIGLGDVVTATPNFIIFNLALTMVGLSVVGLCLAIVQAKVRLVFDRMVRSIDSQYRIRQIDPDVAVMTLIKDENEGVKRLSESQRIQERIVYAVMDEHRKSLLRERWRKCARMVNRATQTYPSRADKTVQTGNRIYDQPKDGEEGDGESIWGDSDDYTDTSNSDESDDEEENASPRRYIYTVYD